jgi:mRNA-degrading endonuclease RelE of RelBE toxin-antitoxin system
MDKKNIKKIINKNKFVDKTVNHQTLDDLGFFVVKNAFPFEIVNKYHSNLIKFFKKKKLNKTKQHPVEVKIDKIKSFQKIYKDKNLKKIAKGFFKGKVGSDFYRIVKKDNKNTSRVFCHQDTGYQIGSFDRYSIFICLTDNNHLNGGLVLYPSTHKFGYLGDAGEISKKITKNYLKICPDLNAGDVLIMHSALWHESDRNFIKSNRIYLEIHIQNLDEPTTKYNILGTKKRTLKPLFKKDNIFSNSRVGRIISFKKKIHLLERKLDKLND